MGLSAGRVPQGEGVKIPFGCCCPPTAQKVPPGSTAIPLSSLSPGPVTGLGDTLQVVPSQCSIMLAKVALGLPLLPTIQPSLAELAATP